MKSRRGVRLPTAPPTRKHGDESRYRRSREHAQNWRDYLDATVDDLMEEKEMERWEAQERLDELAQELSDNHDEYLNALTEQRGEREPVDDDYPTKEESETEEEVSD